MLTAGDDVEDAEDGSDVAKLKRERVLQPEGAGADPIGEMRRAQHKVARIATGGEEESGGVDDERQQPQLGALLQAGEKGVAPADVECDRALRQHAED